MKNLFSVEGKVVLVTGGTRGIGMMIARGFVENGAKVYISSRKADACAEAEAELSKHGTCISIAADLGTREGIAHLAKELAAKEQKLDVLVNNAGANWAEPIDAYGETGWDKVLDLNLKSVFFMTQAVLPMLRKAGAAGAPARVINIGSIDGLHVPGLETYAYSSSKAAVHHLTRTLARRLGGEHITVNAVAPGPFESKMMAATLHAFGDLIKQSAPLGRIGEPSDMAGVAIYLASKAGAYVTGAVIPVDGGIATTV